MSNLATLFFKGVRP